MARTFCEEIMTAKIVLSLLSVSLALNVVLASSVLVNHSFLRDGFLDVALQQIGKLRKAESDQFSGYYLGENEETWPPADEKLSDGIFFWHMRADGTARSISISPIQRWKNDGGRISIKWPSEDFRYYGRFDGEFLTMDHGDYEDFFIRAEFD